MKSASNFIPLLQLAVIFRDYSLLLVLKMNDCPLTQFLYIFFYFFKISICLLFSLFSPAFNSNLKCIVFKINSSANHLYALCLQISSYTKGKVIKKRNPELMQNSMVWYPMNTALALAFSLKDNVESCLVSSYDLLFTFKDLHLSTFTFSHVLLFSQV